MLSCDGVHSFYGASHVLAGVSIAVEAGEIVCLLGRNGVGKSTTLKSIMGLVPPRAGRVMFGGKRIDGQPPHRIARLGLGYVPEDRRVFADLSVEDNLLVAERHRAGGCDWSLAKAYAIFPPLAEFRARRSGYLSGGQQQMLTIARALMGSPSLLLIDEPTEGLSPLVVQQLEQAILDLKREGLTMLIAAQDMAFVTKVADRIYVMNRGAVVFDGTRDDLGRDMASIQTHLLA
jgi:branched-chain amino acid transport system ATP-binding protein